MIPATPGEILVFVECDASGRPTLASLSAVTFARRLSQIKKAALSLCLFQHSPCLDEEALVHLGAETVLVCRIDDELPLRAERLTPTLARLIAERDARVFVASATSTGKDLGPRVAQALDSAFVGDCCKVDEQDSNIVFRRPVYAGNATAHCVVRTARAVVTVRQTEFPASTSNCEARSSVLPFELLPETVASTKIRRLGFEAVTTNRPQLTEAKIVVTGGRALGRRFLEVLEPLADTLGAAIGATRAACDAGMAPSDLQVGQTGKVVAPDLYIAVGVSGAVQHVAGIRSSRVIVAINTDPEAAIFAVADYGLVGDLFDLVPKLVSALQQFKCR
jgi:electron transfer flavoprotein alpha subunit